jgi:hypothetical protein
LKAIEFLTGFLEVFRAKYFQLIPQAAVPFATPVNIPEDNVRRELTKWFN